MKATKELILEEIDDMPEILMQEVLDFARFLKTRISQEKLETLILSESSFGKDWLRPEEKEAWKDLLNIH